MGDYCHTPSTKQLVEECSKDQGGGHVSQSGVHGLEDGIHVKLLIAHQGTQC